MTQRLKREGYLISYDFVVGLPCVVVEACVDGVAFARDGAGLAFAALGDVRSFHFRFVLDAWRRHAVCLHRFYHFWRFLASSRIFFSKIRHVDFFSVCPRRIPRFYLSLFPFSFSIRVIHFSFDRWVRFIESVWRVSLMAIILTLFLSLSYLYLISIFFFPVAACNQRPSKALGQARLSIVKLFKSLIDTNTYTINATLAQIRTLEVLMVGWIHYFTLYIWELESAIMVFVMVMYNPFYLFTITGTSSATSS